MNARTVKMFLNPNMGTVVFIAPMEVKNALRFKRQENVTASMIAK
jgi:hypothetical protein